MKKIVQIPQAPATVEPPAALPEAGAADTPPPAAHGGEELETLDLRAEGGPGMVSLPPCGIVSEESLALAFGKHPVSIRRAVERGELPPSVRLMGKPCWTTAAIVRHLEQRLAAVQEETDVFKRQHA